MIRRELSSAGLALGALGVVFGDIGTSPLYAFSALFGPVGAQLPVTLDNITGIISLVLWSLTIVVSIKFILFIMRSSNDGEGGIMALVALLKGTKKPSRFTWLFISLGLIGAALFYGDSAITPAISVLSAVEGLNLVTPAFNSYILPITLSVLTGLFLVQKYGTAKIGSLFGPVMLIWFSVIGLGGLYRISEYPYILVALSPLTAVSFYLAHPVTAFIALGAVVLVITGAEALYADMGHFGRGPIARAWFSVVFPALALCYLGQGALLLHSPTALSNPFMNLFPGSLQLPVIILATIATVIASQSVLSGAFSLTRQAVQLDFMPKMLVKHTSTRESGQIYMPFVNFLLYLAVIALVLIFGSSAKLAGAYGVAVSGTLAIDTALFVYVAYHQVTKAPIKIAVAGAVFMTVDLLFVGSTLPKLNSGGLLPVLLATVVFIIITTWVKGQAIITAERKAKEGPLQDYIDTLHAAKTPLRRIPGQAVYIGHHADFAPLALHESVDENHELSQKVIIVTVHISHASHVPDEKRATFDNLKYNDGISHVTLIYGYHDVPNVPQTLQSLRHVSPELDFDPRKAAYFISMTKVVRTKRHNLAPWRKVLYSLMDRNAASASDYYKLPIAQTTEIRSMLKL